MSSFLPLFIYLFMSVQTTVYLFYTLSFNLVLCFYFVIHIIPVLTFGKAFRLALASIFFVF